MCINKTVIAKLLYPPLYVLMRQTLTLNDKRGVYSRRSLALGLTYHQLSLKRKHDISQIQAKRV